MRKVWHEREDVGGAREEILGFIQRDPNNNITIYFDGWRGFGAAVVLRSIAQELKCMEAPPPRLCFGRMIYVDCSKWTSHRAMQKEIAQKLELDHETMAMFDEQDEEDDFSGVDLGSRDAIRGVATVIDRNLRESRFMMIFINGSDMEVRLGKLGIPENSDYVILWTFSTRLLTIRNTSDEIAKKLRDTDVSIVSNPYRNSLLSSSVFLLLCREEAANIVAHYPCLRGMDLARVVDCCLYELLLMSHSFGSTTGFPWLAHAPNFWICDGIIPGDRAREISNALHSEISFDCKAYVLNYGVLGMLQSDPKSPFLVLNRSGDNYKERPYRWLSAATLQNKRALEEMPQTILAGASSIFLAFETEHNNPPGLPNGFFKQCSNLGVLVLSWCAFSFLSPPFLHCHTLRFLGLDHCMDNSRNAVELGGGGDCSATWAFLKSVLVIDLYYTDWVEILSEEKIELMANLMELNIEGVSWPRWTSGHQLQKRLPNLQRLRIIRPTYEEAAAETSSSSDSFLMDSTSLQILDLSGSNRVKRRDVAESISKASHLQVLILDGCDGLEDVVLCNNSSLRSFSLDGYGPASSHRTTSTVELPPKMSRPAADHADRKKQNGAVKTSMVSLAGCTRLDKLFLRGLSNLVELDLSGCAIKVLDLGAMVVDVPKLRKLFLLGCVRLCAIKWGSNAQYMETLKLICIDTGPGTSRRVVLGCAQQKYTLVHAVTADARLARSLWDPIIY